METAQGRHFTSTKQSIACADLHFVKICLVINVITIVGQSQILVHEAYVTQFVMGIVMVIALS